MSIIKALPRAWYSRAMALQGGTQLGSYKIRSRLGEGGMGEVYLASAAGPDSVEKPVAIKLIRQLHHQKQDFLAMFLEEFKVSYLLTHPNIVQTYDLGQLEGHFFLVMEYVEGITLADLMRSRGDHGQGPLPVAIALYIGSQVARGLDYAHSLEDHAGHPLHIVHRDVSPCNVLISSSGQVKITDFGLAKSTLRREHTKAGMIKGKMSYMAPEQLKSVPLDHRADLYALGVVLYEMIGGENPFGDPDKLSPVRRFSIQTLPPLSDKITDLDPAILGLVDQCLSADPAQRPTSAREVGRALDQMSRNLGLSMTDYELADFITQATADAKAHTAAPHPFDRALGLELQRVQGAGGVSSFLVATTAASGEQVLSETLPGMDGDLQSLLPRPTASLFAAALHPGRRVRFIVVLLAVVLLAVVLLATLIPDGTHHMTKAINNRTKAADNNKTEAATHKTEATDKRTEAATHTTEAATDQGLKTATLKIEPSVAGARVLIDGKPAGTAPLSLSGLPTHRTIRVRLTRAGRRTYDQQVQLQPGAVLVLRPVLAPRSRSTKSKKTRTKARPKGSLSVNSEPWSVVSIDGVRVGNTPLIGHVLPAGRHHVQLRNPPRKLQMKRTVTIRPGQETRISVELKP